MTVIVMTAIVIVYPHWLDHRLIDRLGSDKLSLRAQAIAEAAVRAKNREQMKDKLIAALDTESDTQFFAIVSTLNAAGLFKTSVTNPLYIDRAMAVEFSTAPDPNTQIWLLTQIINTHHDNRYIRQALKVAAKSEDVNVRIASALLAAKLSDDTTLSELLEDQEPSVRAAAALDASLAGRKALRPTLQKLYKDSEAEVTYNAAIGSAHTTPDKPNGALAGLSGYTDPALRERLCHVIAILNTKEARLALEELTAARGDVRPSAMAILAAGKLKTTGAEKDVRAILSGAVKDPKIDRHLVHSAIIAAGDLNIPVRGELYNICKYWHHRSNWGQMFAAAAKLLGQQAGDKSTHTANAPSRRKCENLLIQLAYYTYQRPTTGPRSPVLKTPIASAAAATAFWLLDPSSDPAAIQLKQISSQPNGLVEFQGRSVTSARVVMYAAQASIFAGDYIAWHLGRSGNPEAFKLALRMIPAIDAPDGTHIYNENLRGTGAMLLAFSAKTDEQKKIAIQRITERLQAGKDHSGEDDPVLAGRYRCALLILGDGAQLETVRDQRNDRGHAVPAAFGALCLAGEIEALDYLLCNTHIPTRDVAAYLVYDGLDRILARCAPSLPTIDQSAPAKIQIWQAKILRDYYVLHRDAIKLELKR
ncbi:MAG: hypothetical protein GY794_15725 [bacterium]|nr:hypothetical protein [bacterium]